MKAVVLCALLVLSSGCTLLGGVAGLVTGPVDCTVLHVRASGPAGLIMFPLTPFEGAFRGGQLGWFTDKAVFNGQEGVRPLAFAMPCTATAIFQAFGGMR